MRKRRESLKKLVLSLSRDMEVNLTFISLVSPTFWCIVRGIIKVTKTVLFFFFFYNETTKLISMLVFVYIILQLQQGTEELEPRLLLFDGHLSHLLYGTIQHAKEKCVTIIKLPAHTTDLLQPLNVSAFKSLKDNWGSILFNRLMRMKISRLSKSEFSTLLSVF